MKKKGQNIGEWFIIVALVSIISMFVLFTIADRLKEVNTNITNKLTQVSQQ